MSADLRPPGPGALRVWVAVGTGDFASYLHSVFEGQREFGYRLTSDPHEADVAVAESDSPMFDSAAWLAQLRQAGGRPRLPVLFLGGGEAAWARLRSSGDVRIARLALPFNANSLRAAIRNLVEGSGAG